MTKANATNIKKEEKIINKIQIPMIKKIGNNYFIIVGERKWIAVDGISHPVSCDVVESGRNQIYWQLF